MEVNLMKFNFNDVESEKIKNQKFAENNGISQEEMDEIYQKIYAELPENLTGDKRELRALRKTRGSLRQRANRTGTELDGFILIRFRDKDFESNAWNKVDNFVQENGIDAAREQGMVNDNGDYVHTAFTTNFSNQHNKVIDKNNVTGQAVGIVINENGEQELRFLTIGKFNVFEKIPLCREVSLIIKEGNKAGPLFPDRNNYFVNGVKVTGSTNAYYSDEDFEAYTEIIEDLCGDIFYDTKSEIDQYAHEHVNDRFNFIAVATNSVIRIGMPLDDGTVPIELEVDDGSITVWSSKNVFKDLTIEEGIPGVALLNTYVNKNNEPGYRIGGFLPYM